MKQFFPLLLSLCLFTACSVVKKDPEPFSPEMLARQTFRISSAKDTVVQTLHGSLLRFAAGSFAADEAEIEVREALAPAEIFAAGLVTESNGSLLRSGGMIYINAGSAEKPVELLKPVKVSVPNKYYDSAMQVYKGVENDSGGINWVDPAPVDSTPQSKNWQRGKMLFQSSCTPCHDIFRDMNGPALRGVTERIPDRTKIYRWIRNAPTMVETDPYFRKLRQQYGVIMVPFSLPDTAIDAILEYIETETKRPGAPAALQVPGPDTSVTLAVADTNLPGDPCPDDTVYLPIPKQDLSFFNASAQNTLPDSVVPTPAAEPGEPVALKEVEERVTSFNDRLWTSGVYDFEIRTWGWYNIDAGMPGYRGTSIVKIWAHLQGEFDPVNTQVYLFCPDKQILSVGNEREGDQNEIFYFNKIDGGVPLFPGDRAILFAFGSKDEKMFYGISEFTITPQQSITVTLRPTTPAAITQALLSKRMNGIDLGIEKKEKVVIKNPCADQFPAASAAPAR